MLTASPSELSVFFSGSASQLERKGITPKELDAINHDLKKVAQSEHEMVVDMEKLHQTVERLSKGRGETLSGSSCGTPEQGGIQNFSRPGEQR